jgi:ParB family chromosome partitioning protein
MTDNISQITLSEIVRNPYQPRQNFDETKLDELAASLKENGLLQPIIVRPSAITGYELLAGERRFLAAQKAGLTQIPAIIREYSDQEMMTLSILENLQREDLNPLEEAQSLKNLAEKAHLTHEEIARVLGKSRSYVSNLIRILQLPKELLYLVEQGQISFGHARALLTIPDEVRQIDLARQVIRKKLSVRELEKLVTTDDNSVSKGSPKKSVKSDTNIFLAESEENLKKILGNTVKINANSHYQGQLSVKFDNLEELENLLQKLQK